MPSTWTEGVDKRPRMGLERGRASNLLHAVDQSHDPGGKMCAAKGPSLELNFKTEATDQTDQREPGTFIF